MFQLHNVIYRHGAVTSMVFGGRATTKIDGHTVSDIIAPFDVAQRVRRALGHEIELHGRRYNLRYVPRAIRHDDIVMYHSPIASAIILSAPDYHIIICADEA